MAQFVLFFLSIFFLSAQSLHAQSSNHAKQIASQPGFEAFTGKITGSRVRMRSKPDLDGVIIKEFEKDELLIVRGLENDFYAIEAPKGMKGYVFRSYILDNVVEASKVNIRLEPSIDAPVIGYLTAGSHVDGTISKENTKWLEIDLPKTTRFFVAKEYIEQVGRPELFEIQQKRTLEVNSLLSNAYAFSQSEMRKPFEQIQIGAIQSRFQHIIQNYSDFPLQVSKAKETLQLIQETYLNNKIAYLESKNKESSETYQKQLAALEEKLTQNLGLEPFQEKAQEATTLFTSSFEASQIWIDQENRLFQRWLEKNPGKNMTDFYQKELTSSTTLKGIVEPYTSAVKNRPGDFVLKVNQVPVAFLYSTLVNLNEKVGKIVTVVVSARPNYSFAYPAYFVFSAQTNNKDL